MNFTQSKQKITIKTFENSILSMEYNEQGYISKFRDCLRKEYKT